MIADYDGIGGLDVMVPWTSSSNLKWTEIRDLLWFKLSYKAEVKADMYATTPQCDRHVHLLSRVICSFYSCIMKYCPTALKETQAVTSV